MKNRERFTIIVEWEPCEGNDEDIVIKDLFDLHEYIESTLQSNAQYDGVEMKILDMCSVPYKEES